MAIAFPDGGLGIAAKVALALVGAVWWTSAPGADEASDAKAKAEKRNQYSRHYAFKGRGRKEHLRGDVKMDRCELVPSRSS
ncbi:hypothetical protein OEZ86_003861 [Tetradesmus obliquus]|uniref:Uncharacterized protein n=2 Tax=Tetradesmus obliquus TaxID=3088 RepID=A0A383VG12_TETOB|nr:hypothetical protein OEZ85_001896 [Tetradesmus obliquus]WIA35417.1 hypothetical protein OEZ86_003861 [Tetradesmus obliquus]|eukprot:jgi/Sobl393_1/14199/SZX63729.1